jgi:uncharacterized membrane protein
MRPARVAMAGLALAGLAIATYLTIVHYAGATPACAIAHGCEVVQTSRWATLGGVPVALLGAGAYAALLAGLVRDTDATRTAGAFVALAGAGFSAWLTYVEVAELHAICAWCVTSAALMAALAALSVSRLAGPPAADRRAPSPRRRAGRPRAGAPPAARRP